MISSFSYLGISTPTAQEWTSFGPEVLGLQLTSDGPDGSVRLKMDDVAYRLALHQGDHDDVDYIGWEVVDEVAATEIARAVEAQGIEVHRSTPDLDELRAVAGLLWFADPFGFRHELAWGRLTHPSSFRPGRASSGFLTGEQGMGHVVLLVPSIAQADEFYSGVMGFKLSDRIIEGPISARFYHVNGRHHSLAVVEAPVIGMHHLMLEVNSLDDVGTAQDLCEDRGVPITQTLGRHTNDRMTSIYLRSPSSFDIEYGWGGLPVDDLWTPKTFHRMSIWGHRRPAAAAELSPGLIRAFVEVAP